MKYIESKINKCFSLEDFDKIGNMFYDLEQRGYIMTDYQIMAQKRIDYLKENKK